jgi:hypothetical protein
MGISIDRNLFGENLVIAVFALDVCGVAYRPTSGLYGFCKIIFLVAESVEVKCAPIREEDWNRLYNLGKAVAEAVKG